MKDGFMKALRWMNRLCLLSAAVAFPMNATAKETEEIFGASTNGICASAKYIPFYPGGGHFIPIFIHFSSPSTNIADLSQFDDGKFNKAKYFNATNSFIGFIELKTTDGNKVSLLKPKVNFQSEYPDFYSLKQAQFEILPLSITGSDPEAGHLQLKEYFKIEKPGDYLLTVWPKIYKRSETNHDLVNRIDLPPVTIPIHWTESLR